jgi:DNA-binding transcriptional LysR family regulator
MDRLEAMSVLITAIEAGSLSAAARALDMPLPTVSRKVMELERHLNARLLIRTTRKLTLTDAGRRYVTACTRILDEVREAERAAAGEYLAPRGDLVVTAPMVFGRLLVLPVVADFLRTYPEIQVRLVLADRTLHLQDDHVDVAVRIGPLPDSSLVATGIGQVRRVTCASPAYLAQRGEPTQPGDLATHDCVHFEGMGPGSAWTFPSGKTTAEVPIRCRLAVTTAEAAIDAAIDGLGITRALGYQVADARRRGALQLLLESFEPDPWPVHLVHGGHGLLPLKLRAFLEFTALLR